jgi:hypothetical protein
MLFGNTSAGLYPSQIFIFKWLNAGHRADLSLWLANARSQDKLVNNSSAGSDPRKERKESAACCLAHRIGFIDVFYPLLSLRNGYINCIIFPTHSRSEACSPAAKGYISFLFLGSFCVGFLYLS